MPCSLPRVRDHDQHRHCKPILLLDKAETFLQKAGITQALPNGDPDPELIVTDNWKQGIKAFIQALGRPRDYSRETDPPIV